MASPQVNALRGLLGELRIFLFFCKIFGCAPVYINSENTRVIVSRKAKFYNLSVALVLLFYTLYDLKVRLTDKTKYSDRLSLFCDLCSLIFATSAALTFILCSCTLKQRDVDTFCLRLISMDTYMNHIKHTALLRLGSSHKRATASLSVYFTVATGYSFFLIEKSYYFLPVMRVLYIQALTNIITIQFLVFNLLARRGFGQVNKYLLQLFGMHTEDVLTIKITEALCSYSVNKASQREKYLFVSYIHLHTTSIKTDDETPFNEALQNYEILLTRKSFKLLRMLRKVYCLLHQTALSVNNAYGVQNLVEISSYFVGIVVNMHLLAVSVFDSGGSLREPLKTHKLLRLSLWTGLMVLRLMIIAYSSEMIVQEANRTQRLVTKLQMLPVPAGSGCQEELQLFEEQLARSPLHYSAAGFFTLDVSLLKSFVAAITTYLVILIQLEIPDTNKQQYNVTGSVSQGGG
ncbi:uncharacterized protein LOC126260470 [Schistocerca nitens]|uniref:uncharacterized protein LOC126260470 n=1 Tax=Schistocerca nitens TaxID=7011 RepID=UPI00211942A6|nr:uncharacterized protein LOC126260470 [Schistocerca nitens]